MPLELRNFEEADVEKSFGIGNRAHRSNGGLGALLITTDEVPPDELQTVTQSRLKAMREKKGRVFLIKIVDTDANDKLVAYAIYNLDINGRTEDELDKACAAPPCPPDSQHPDAWNDLFGYLGRERRKHLGLRPACYITSVHTDPDYHRRGCGGQLMSHIVKHADQVGLRCYLEATSTGKRLYDKYGFEVIYTERFDLTKYGMTGEQIDYVMERPPKIDGASS